MDWDSAAKRDRVRSQGSIPAWVGLPKPKSLQKSRPKSKAWEELTAKARASFDPILDEFSKLPELERIAQADAYRERIRVAHEVLMAAVPANRVKSTGGVGNAELRALRKIATLSKITAPSKPPLTVDDFVSAGNARRSRKRSDFVPAGSPASRPAKKSHAQETSQAVLPTLVVDATFAGGILYASWSDFPGARSWQIVVRDRHRKIRKTRKLAPDLLATQLEALSPELSPYELQVTAKGPVSSIASGRATNLEMRSPGLRLAVWNSRWARGERGSRTRELLARLGAGVLVVTEADEDVLPKGGFVISSQPDYGYPIHEGRRKVLLWSRSRWSSVDTIGDERLPSGRFVAGTTITDVGPTRIVGVCIPWRDAHVRGGHRDRKAWEDHLAFLEGLRGIIESQDPAAHLVVAGDFNQRVPRTRQPRAVADALEATFAQLRIVTAGDLPVTSGRLIDHVAIRPPLTASGVEPLLGIAARLSDHDGVVVSIEGPAASPHLQR